MQAFIDDGLAIVIACLAIAAVASALIVFRPWKHRHRRRHARRPKIDLFKDEHGGAAPKIDA
jgi:hypothetical protein